MSNVVFLTQYTDTSLSHIRFDRDSEAIATSVYDISCYCKDSRAHSLMIFTQDQHGPLVLLQDRGSKLEKTMSSLPHENRVNEMLVRYEDYTDVESLSQDIFVRSFAKQQGIHTKHLAILISEYRPKERQTPTLHLVPRN